MDLIESEAPRAEYHGETRRSPVDDDLNEIHYRENRRLAVVVAGVTLSSFIVMIVLSLVAAITIFKTHEQGVFVVGEKDVTADIAGLLNALQIEVFNFLYNELATKLN